jgi:hypothetical protein
MREEVGYISQKTAFFIVTAVKTSYISAVCLRRTKEKSC